MGKFEKLVVLAVLFTAALVLALALNRGPDEAEASDPLGGARRVLDLGTDAGGAVDLRGAGSATQPGTLAPSTYGETPLPGALSAGARREGELGGKQRGAGQAPSLLLNAGAESELTRDDARFDAGAASALTLEPQSDPTRRILLDVQGLRPSFLEDYRMYTLVQGDTWPSLALRFYQDERYTRNLHLANEDLEQLTPGKDILVPVFDFLAVDAGLRPGAGAAEFAGADTTADTDGRVPGASLSAAAGSAPARGAKVLEYEVRSGDTLSDISLKVFGTATRWKEILESNRDKLQRPESLQVGMKLKIPDGGKLPAPEKKPEAKPKTAERSDKTAAKTKKKKVL